MTKINNLEFNLKTPIGQEDITKTKEALTNRLSPFSAGSLFDYAVFLIFTFFLISDLFDINVAISTKDWVPFLQDILVSLICVMISFHFIKENRKKATQSLSSLAWLTPEQSNFEIKILNHILEQSPELHSYFESLDRDPVMIEYQLAMDTVRDQINQGGLYNAA